MNESTKIVWTDTDHKLQFKSKYKVDSPIRNKNKVTAKRYTDEKARIISKQASAKNMMQMRKQEE
jgi:hypothetical protein